MYQNVDEMKEALHILKKKKKRLPDCMYVMEKNNVCLRKTDSYVRKLELQIKLQEKRTSKRSI